MPGARLAGWPIPCALKQVQQPSFGTQPLLRVPQLISDFLPQGGCRDCGRRQLLGRFWDMHDQLYANQQSWVPMGEDGLRRGHYGPDTPGWKHAAQHDVDERIQHDFMTEFAAASTVRQVSINSRMFQGDGNLSTALFWTTVGVADPV